MPGAIGRSSPNAGLRAAIVGMWHETNTYSARRTSLEQFEQFELVEGEQVIEHHSGTGSVVGGFLDGLQAPSPSPGGGAIAPIGVLSAGAWPGGPIGTETAETLLGRLERALRRAPEVDGVLVNLHGAMVAEGHSDMEHETLRRLRARFGAVPLVAVMDLHANPSSEAAAECDAIVGYRTYPHVDMHACGVEAAGLLARALGGERLFTSHGRLAHLTSPIAQGTHDAPMRDLLAAAEGRAHRSGVLRVSLFPGFPYSDVDRSGFAVTAVSSRAAASAAAEVVRRTLAEVRASLDQFTTDRPKPGEAVARALEAGASRPVVLADVADNIGGGGPGDGTAILSELVARGVGGAVVPLVDPVAAARAREAGVGAVLDLELGGHTDALHGDPVRAQARVVSLGDGRYRSAGTYMTGQEFSMGPTAVLDLDGVLVLAMSIATPPFHIEQLTANGIDPRQASVIALKGALAWRDPYSAVMGSFIEVDTPGCCPADPYALKRSSQLTDIEPAAA